MRRTHLVRWLLLPIGITRLLSTLTIAGLLLADWREARHHHPGVAQQVTAAIDRGDRLQRQSALPVGQSCRQGHCIEWVRSQVASAAAALGQEVDRGAALLVHQDRPVAPLMTLRKRHWNGRCGSRARGCASGLARLASVSWHGRILRRRPLGNRGKEERVEQHQRRRRAALVVRVRHEPSRVAAACLADAYERVVPVVRRGDGRWEAPAHAAATTPSYRQGGIAG